MSKCALISNPEEQLFALAQSNDGSMGFFASCIAVKTLEKRLGSALQNQVDNLGSTRIQGDKQHARIDSHIRATINSAFQELSDHISLQTKLNGSKLDSPVTSVFAKVINAAENSKHAYIGSIGDSRVYIHRAGTLYQLTQDHTELFAHVLGGQMSQEEFEAIDQVVDPHKLTRNQKHFFSLRDRVYGIGAGEDVQAYLYVYEVAPGDRIVLVNNGVHKNLLRAEIQAALNQGRDDDQAMGTISQMVEEQIQSSMPRGRTTNANATLIVHTVTDQKTPVKEKPETSDDLQKKLSDYKRQELEYRMQVHHMEQELQNPRHDAALRSMKREQLNKCKKATMDYREKIAQCENLLNALV